MEMKNVTAKHYKEVIESENYALFVDAIKMIFKTDENISNWVYSGNASLPEYLNATGNKESVISVSDNIVSIFKANGLHNIIDTFKKDKTPYKFVSSWLTKNGMPTDIKSKFSKVSSSSRNMYCFFLSMLTSFTQDK
jgi:hypothetical protein